MSRQTRPCVRRAGLAVSGCLLLLSACALLPARSPDSASSVQLAQLVVSERALAGRDLFWGPGGKALAPPTDRPFRFLEEDHSGGSPSMEVKDANGLVWDVKWGPEAAPEVVASRLVWAAGFHQLPSYYVSSWTLEGRPGGAPGPARFRPFLPGWTVLGTWDWRDNPFVGTRELGGLVAMMVLINNWDLKTEQNVIFEVGGGKPALRYTVLDLGAALGRSGFFNGSKGDLAGFEHEPFIAGVENDLVRFHFRGGWREPLLTRDVPVDAVVWLCRRLAARSDGQLRAAFRAGGYSKDVDVRYVKHLRRRLEEGLRVAQLAKAH